MAAQDTHEREASYTAAATFEEAPKCADTNESDLGEANVAQQRRFGRRPAAAAALALLGVAAVAAWRLGGRGAGGGTGEAAEAAETGDAVSLADSHAGLAGPFGEYAGHAGPFGEYAGPAPPFASGKRFYGVPSANMGSPPQPEEHHSLDKPPGCLGIGCNGGKLCCGSDAICCGTSCCSGGSTCCNAELGLCCAQGTMCCYRKFCCSPSWKCGDTRIKTGGLRYEILQQCGGGAQIRRLMDEVHYRQQFRMLLATNETGLKELLGVPVGQAEQDEK